MVRTRILAIACGYEDADDLDALRVDPAFKLACGRLPDTGANLCSQPTLSRLENAPSLKDAIRLTWALVDQWMASYDRQRTSVILDIDDTCDVVHGQSSSSRSSTPITTSAAFLPIHVYDGERSQRPVAVVLRPGKTPSGRRSARSSAPARAPYPSNALDEDAHHIPRRRPLRPTQRRWNGARPTASITSSGLPGSKPLAKKIDEAAEAVRTERAVSNKPVVRGYAGNYATRPNPGTASGAPSPASKPHPLGLDTRFVVTNVEYGAAEWVYDTLYCARGQAENLIKLHKTQLASRSNLPAVPPSATRSASFCTQQRPIGSCSPFATLIPKPRDLANAEFSTLRLRLIKIAARVSRNRKPRPSRFRRQLPEGPICSRSLCSPLSPSAPERPGKKAPPPPVIPPTRS